MSSIIKVQDVQNSSGANIINESSNTITIGASGDTITVPTGASLTVPNGGLSGQNYPAFEVYLSASQQVSDVTYTKCEFDTERFDTDNCYDNSTNYRFTPTVAGKYYVYCQIELDAKVDGQNAMAIARIYKNGTAYQQQILETTGNAIGRFVAVSVVAVIDMNGTTDYVEGWGYVDDTANSPAFLGGANPARTFFGAFRIGD